MLQHGADEGGCRCRAATHAAGDGNGAVHRNGQRWQLATLAAA